MDEWISHWSHLGEFQQSTRISPSTKPAVGKITIAYGTETGNSKRLATDFAAMAKKKGINPKLVSLDQYRLNDLSREEYFLTIISTQGDGEPPAAAKKFYDHIHQHGFALNKLKYGVLALGDTAYPLFCKAGEDVDEQLNKLGGERIITLQKCDTDYQTEASTWFNQVLEQLQTGDGNVLRTPSSVPQKKSSGKKIYTGTVLTNINLNDRGSSKETYHIEIEAEDLVYQPGDSIGIVPENPLSVVEGILSITRTLRDHPFPYRDQTFTAIDLLRKKLNITLLRRPGCEKICGNCSTGNPCNKNWIT